MFDNETIGEFNLESISKVIAVNAISPLLITEALIANLHSGSKIIMITSRMGSIEDNSSGGRYSYRMSKAALNAASKSLSIDLKDKNIIVGIIHPGHVATDMGGEKGIPVVDSVKGILQVVDNYKLANSGVFYHMDGHVLPW